MGAVKSPWDGVLSGCLDGVRKLTRPLLAVARLAALVSLGAAPVLAGPAEREPQVARAGEAAQESPVESVSGVDFRIWLTRLIWEADEVPQFEARLSHRGARELPRVGPCELELDGVWYLEWPDDVERDGAATPRFFTPQTDYHLTGLALDATWRHKESGDPPELRPGRHRVRLAFRTEAADRGPGESVRVATNAVEFRILRPGEKATEAEWFELALGWWPGSKYSPQDVAAKHRELYGQELPPAALADFYARQALALAQTAPDPFLLADLTERALALDQDEMTRAKLHSNLGGAYMGQVSGRVPRERQRRLAAEAYLIGLGNLLLLDLPEAPPEPFGYPDGYVLSGTLGSAAGYPTREQRERASQKGAARIRELVQMRGVLTMQIASLYPAEADAYDELRSAALRRLGSDAAAEQVVNAAREHQLVPGAPVPAITVPRRTDARQAESATEAARFMKAYDAEGSVIEAGFIPDETSTVLGQPLFITFMTINRSDRPYRFDVGGDNRGSVRHNSFHITAADQDGQPVADPYSYDNFGGFGGTVVLEPGQTYMERLYLGHWCAFGEPGLYAVTCTRTLAGGERDRQEAALPVTTTFDLTIAPSDADGLGDVIADLGRRIREGHEQAVFEATLGLSQLPDERVIPHLAASLGKGDYQNRLPAIEGLSRFSTDAAADALLPALKDPDHVVRGAAGKALHAMGKVDRALAALLKEPADRGPQTRALTACALGATKAREALTPLVQAMEDPDPMARHAAARALGELGNREAVESLRQRLEDRDMAMRVAVVQGLLGLGEPLDVEWLTPVIRAAADVNDQSFHEAISLIRQHGGKEAAPALASCVAFDDPSMRNSYNMFLILGIEFSPEGPKYYYRYHHDPNVDGSPQQVEENRKILEELRTWLQEQQGPLPH